MTFRLFQCTVPMLSFSWCLIDHNGQVPSQASRRLSSLSFLSILVRKQPFSCYLIDHNGQVPLRLFQCIVTMLSVRCYLTDDNRQVPSQSSRLSSLSFLSILVTFHWSTQNIGVQTFEKTLVFLLQAWFNENEIWRFQYVQLVNGRYPLL